MKPVATKQARPKATTAKAPTAKASPARPRSAKPRTVAAKPEAAPALLPVHEELVREEAYFVFAESGHQHGRDLDNWLQAEARVRQRLGPTPAPKKTAKRKPAA